MRCLRESHVKLSSIVSFFEMVYVVFERAGIKLQQFYNILDSKHRYWVELFDIYLLYDAWELGERVHTWWNDFENKVWHPVWYDSSDESFKHGDVITNSSKQRNLWQTFIGEYLRDGPLRTFESRPKYIDERYLCTFELNSVFVTLSWDGNPCPGFVASTQIVSRRYVVVWVAINDSVASINDSIASINHSNTKH